jgi:hypothetical protein
MVGRDSMGVGGIGDGSIGKEEHPFRMIELKTKKLLIHPR